MFLGAYQNDRSKTFLTVAYLSMLLAMFLKLSQKTRQKADISAFAVLGKPMRF